MLSRIIKSAIEIVRPPPVGLNVLVDLGQRTFDLGSDIEVVVAVTSRNDAIHVVQCGLTLVLEFEIERIHTTSVSVGSGMRMTATVPKSTRIRSVDSHRMDTVEILNDEKVEPGQQTYPAKLSVPEDLPRPPDDAVSSITSWKIVAELELSDGGVFSSEQAVTPSK
jgi:hypothetical protein